ncbi:MAG TPA: alpha/beta fold hydrolase [Gemmatimonadaceae bacterium]|jgi:alpha-beta hydrolase superfamily lysophospholipase|nr:alpha/beta fold hydrolase [Gemmatimonadaceae bacterium]
MTEVNAASPEAFEIPCKDGLSIRGEVYPAESSIGTVVLCHGFKGFAHWGFFPYLARTLAENGLTAITFDFSGSGIGPDRESFTEPGAFAGNTLSREQEDLENLVDYARRRKLIEGKFGMFGHSRGGGTAILFTAGTDSNVSSLVTWSSISYPNRWSSEDVITWRRQGYADVTNSRTGQIMRLDTDLLDDVELHGKTKLDMEAAARKIKVPWLIVHGTGDETVPSSEAERLHELSPGVSTLRLIKGANHGFDAKHPLGEAPPVLEKVVLETVKFFVRNATPR